jgi:hypothetical protein
MATPPVTPAAKFEDDDAHDRSAFGAVDDLSAEPEPPKPAAAEPAAAATPAAAPPAPREPAPTPTAAAPPAPRAEVGEPSELPAGRRAIDSEPAEGALPELAEPAREPDARAVDTPAVDTPAADAPEADEPRPAVEAPAPGAARFPGARIALAVPLSLGEDELMIYVSGKGSSRLAYPRIRAVSLAGVRGLGPRPVVLVDLLLSGPQPGPEPLALVRLRSDQYDPRKLIASSASPLDALIALVEELLKRTRAVALPDDAAGRGRPLAMFDSLDAYSDAVLRISGG